MPCHMHAIVLIPPQNRLRHEFRVHVELNRDLYVHHPISRIHVAPIESRAGHVTGYGLKSLGKRRADHDDLIVLPRSVHELPSRISMRGNASIFGTAN